MVIYAVQEVLSGCLKISTNEEPPFFIREVYLRSMPLEKLTNLITYSLSKEAEPLTLTEEETEEIIEAKNAFLCEKAALNYVARAEQGRFLLSRKLEAKGFDKNSISKALDYMEEKGYIDDARFALSWLHSRAGKNEGRLKLSNELLARGIKKDVAKSVLDDFFEENDEKEKCEKEYKKLLSKGLKGENDEKFEKKIYDRLVRLGFSSKIIREVKRTI